MARPNPLDLTVCPTQDPVAFPLKIVPKLRTCMVTIGDQNAIKSCPAPRGSTRATRSRTASFSHTSTTPWRSPSSRHTRHTPSPSRRSAHCRAYGCCGSTSSAGGPASLALRSTGNAGARREHVIINRRWFWLLCVDQRNTSSQNKERKKERESNNEWQPKERKKEHGSTRARQTAPTCGCFKRGN